MGKSRGLRNCNPGNIRLSRDKWKGLKEKQEDKAFFQFVGMEWGYRALIKTLQNYHKLHGCKTIADYIRRWAPEKENNTAGYINNVCKELQVPSSYIIDIEDNVTMCAFAGAISRVENGVPAVMEEVERGWELL